MSHEELNNMNDLEVSSNEDFKSQLPEDLRNDSSLQDIKDVSSLAKSYISAQRMLGNSVRIPSEDAGDDVRQEFYSKLDKVPGVLRAPDPDNAEAMDAFYRRLGRPEDPAKYNVALPEHIPDPGPALDQFKNVAFEAGLTNQQAEKLVGFYVQNLAAPQIDNSEQQREQCESALRQKWGGEYDARMNGAKLVVAQYAQKHPETIRDLVDGPAGNNPAFIEMLSDLARGMSESEVVQGIAKVQYGMSSEEAKEQIQEIRNNGAHPFHDERSPDHSAAVQKMQRLYRIAYPE